MTRHGPMARLADASALPDRREAPVDLAGRIALVTGAGRRVGRAIATALGARGMHVAVHYNGSAEGAKETAADIGGWWKNEPEDRRAKLRAGLSPERDKEVLAALQKKA